MQRLRVFTALVLLALWLPARLHCGVEAAGLAFQADCASGETHHEHAAHHGSCTTDDCASVEGGFRSSSSAHTVAPAAVFTASLFSVLALPPLDLASPAPPNGIGVALAAPPEISRSWVFVLRAARLPGAPAFV